MSWALFARDFNDELTHSKVISGLFSVTPRRPRQCRRPDRLMAGNVLIALYVGLFSVTTVFITFL